MGLFNKEKKQSKFEKAKDLVYNINDFSYKKNRIEEALKHEADEIVIYYITKDQKSREPVYIDNLELSKEILTRQLKIVESKLNEYENQLENL